MLVSQLFDFALVEHVDVEFYPCNISHPYHLFFLFRLPNGEG